MVKIESGDANSVQVVGLHNYSLSETDTGVKWIDGKTIYRKVIDFGVIPTSTVKNVAHGITDLDTVVLLSGQARYTSVGTRIGIPWNKPNEDDNYIALAIVGDNVSIATTYGYSLYDEIFIIIEYTKT